jgi:hypothetical protein
MRDRFFALTSGSFSAIKARGSFYNYSGHFPLAIGYLRAGGYSGPVAVGNPGLVRVGPEMNPQFLHGRGTLENAWRRSRLGEAPNLTKFNRTDLRKMQKQNSEEFEFRRGCRLAVSVGKAGRAV